MIDINLLRQQKEKIKELLFKKEPQFNVELLLEKDSCVRNLKSKVEQLRKQKNDLALQGSSDITREIRTQSIELGKHIKTLEAELKTAENDLANLWTTCPNIPADDVPKGGKES